MNGKENIINKILADADAECARIAAAAQAEAQRIADEVERQIKCDNDKTEERLKSLADESKRNATAVAQLNARKYRLNARQQLVSQCYAVARERLSQLSSSERLGVIGTLLEKYAEQGETVYITQADSAAVTQQYLDGFEKGLVLGKRYINAEGGVMLEGVGYDKDLTFDRIVRYCRENSEARVAAQLFGDGNE